jgi:hypothetical protein
VILEQVNGIKHFLQGHHMRVLSLQNHPQSGKFFLITILCNEYGISILIIHSSYTASVHVVEEYLFNWIEWENEMAVEKIRKYVCEADKLAQHLLEKFLHQHAQRSAF